MKDLSTRWERTKALLFHALPHHLISRVTFKLTRLKIPFVTLLSIKLFIRVFHVTMDDAREQKPDAYSTFNAFFVRSLKAGVRDIAIDETILTSPADGRISQIGDLLNGRILQAKGQYFSALELLGGSPQRSAPFHQGKFCTIYLSPRDYHKVHMPFDATLVETVYVPGRLFSVSPYATRTIPRLFARNERVCALFETRYGKMAIVMVGAINVAAIETVWAGLMTPPNGKRIQVFDHSLQNQRLCLKKADEMGRFNMGSTVIVLLPLRDFAWQAGLTQERQIRMGEGLGQYRVTG